MEMTEMSTTKKTRTSEGVRLSRTDRTDLIRGTVKFVIRDMESIRAAGKAPAFDREVVRSALAALVAIRHNGREPSRCQADPIVAAVLRMGGGSPVILLLTDMETRESWTATMAEMVADNQHDAEVLEALSKLDKTPRPIGGTIWASVASVASEGGAS